MKSRLLPIADLNAILLSIFLVLSLGASRGLIRRPDPPKTETFSISFFETGDTDPSCRTELLWLRQGNRPNVDDNFAVAPTTGCGNGTINNIFSIEEIALGDHSFNPVLHHLEEKDWQIYRDGNCVRMSGADLGQEIIGFQHQHKNEFALKHGQSVRPAPTKSTTTYFDGFQDRQGPFAFPRGLVVTTSSDVDAPFPIRIYGIQYFRWNVASGASVTGTSYRLELANFRGDGRSEPHLLEPLYLAQPKNFRENAVSAYEPFCEATAGGLNKVITSVREKDPKFDPGNNVIRIPMAFSITIDKSGKIRLDGLEEVNGAPRP